jgi:ferredoxin
MPVIRFLREGRDVECYPGENLRDVALREGIELYGLKGRLGNCGGCGQCITCFVDVEGASPAALSAQTAVEEQKLRRRPQSHIPEVLSRVALHVAAFAQEADDGHGRSRRRGGHSETAGCGPLPQPPCGHPHPLPSPNGSAVPIVTSTQT